MHNMSYVSTGPFACCIPGGIKSSIPVSLLSKSCGVNEVASVLDGLHKTSCRMFPAVPLGLLKSYENIVTL